MGGNLFDQLAQDILKQKQYMEKLETENQKLRQQIADLRAGRGISVDICGTRFVLRADSPLAQITTASPVPASDSTSTSIITTSDPETPVPSVLQTVDAPTAEMANVTPQAQDPVVKEEASPSNEDSDKKSLGEESTFLEEIMIDQFNSALASPNAVWQGPTEKKPAKQQRKQEEPIDEKQKAVLRRELMGSYLLE